MARRPGQPGGAGPSRPSDEDAAPAEPEELEPADTDLDAPEILAALARLEAEVAQAYAAAADGVDDADLRDRLQAFARDHLRDVRDLDAARERLGASGLEASLPQAPLLLPVLARMAAPLGTDEVILALLANAQLATLAHEDALEYDWDDDAIDEVLERSRADAQRDLEWLHARHEALADEAEPPGASA